MIYNLENTIDAGRPVDRVVDANGVEYEKAIEVDTETGRIEKLAQDENGKVILTYDGNEIAREVVQAAPPITVTFRLKAGEEQLS